MPLQRPNLTAPLAGPLPLAAGRVLWCPDFAASGHHGYTVRRDVSGTANNLTLVNGPVCVPGPSAAGMAVRYDGVNDYAEAASAASLDSTTCTWAVSFRTTATGSFTWLFGRAGAVFSEEGVLIILRDTGVLQWGVKNNADYVAEINGSAVVTDGLWHRAHLVMTGASGTLYAYLDGALVGADAASAAWAFNGQVVRVADGLDAFFAPFAGDIGNEAVWNRALTAAEVYQDWLAERSGNFPVRRIPLVQGFNTGGGDAAWTPTPDVAWELSAWTWSVTGSGGNQWTPAPNVLWELSAWTWALTPTYSINVTWTPPNVAWQLTNWVAEVVQPPSTIRNPLVARVPRGQPQEALVRHTEKVAAIINGLSRYGQIVQYGPTDYRLYGAAYVRPRAPGATDDSTMGYFIGVLWVDSSASPRDAYLMTDDAVGAAEWLQL